MHGLSVVGIPRPIPTQRLLFFCCVFPSPRGVALAKFNIGRLYSGTVPLSNFMKSECDPEPPAAPSSRGGGLGTLFSWTPSRPPECALSQPTLSSRFFSCLSGGKGARSVPVSFHFSRQSPAIPTHSSFPSVIHPCLLQVSPSLKVLPLNSFPYLQPTHPYRGDPPQAGNLRLCQGPFSLAFSNSLFRDRIQCWL